MVIQENISELKMSDTVYKLAEFSAPLNVAINSAPPHIYHQHHHYFHELYNISFDPRIDDEGFEDECPMHIVLEIFSTYYQPILIFVGLLGNILSCIVFLSTHLKLRSSSYYLAALALADFGFLSMLLVVYLANNTIYDYYNKPGLCQMVVYFSSTFSVLSVWLIVAFTVERFIAVQYPLQRPHICTVTRAKCIIAIITSVALLTQTYSFFTAGVMKRPHTLAGHSGNPGECTMVTEHLMLMQVINVLDTLLTLVGPFILIVVMNTMIARNLLMFRKRFQTSPTMDEYMNGERSDVNLHILMQSGASSTRRGTSLNSHNSASRQTASRRSKTSDQMTGCIHSGRNFVTSRNQQSITKMLLMISSVFLILNFPSYVLRIYVFLISLWEQTPPAWLWCTQQFFMLLYYTNFSVNFLLYAMCGVTFRRCLWKLVRKNLKAFTKHCTAFRRFRQIE